MGSYSNEETNRNVPNMNQKSSRVHVEVGNSSTENFDDLNDAQVTDYKQLSYKLFQYRTYKLRGSDGEFGCPFCDDYKEKHECRYTHLLLHAIRVAESEQSGKQRANHFGMARFLAIDLAEEVKAEADRSEDGKRLKRPRLDEDRTKGEVDLAGKVRQLEEELNELGECFIETTEELNEKTEKLNEKTEELNDLLTRERQSNDELQGVRRELIKGLNDILKGNHVHIGIKNMGEIDPTIFISEMEKRFPPIDAEMIGVELCSLWQNKLNNPHWYPFQIIVDENGNNKRIPKEDDTSLQDLKKKWGQEIHDAVVGALNDLHDYNSSGCYVVPELWNFKENRKAKLDEVISYILEAFKDVSKMGTTSEINNSRINEHRTRGRCLGKQREISVSKIFNSDEVSNVSDSEIDEDKERIYEHRKIGRCLGKQREISVSRIKDEVSDSEIYEHKERIYELLKSCAFKVRGPSGELRCPFCSVEEDRGYNYLLRHALAVGEGSSESAKQRAMHFALAKYLVIDLQHNATHPPPQSTSSPASSSGGDEEIEEEVQSEPHEQLNDATMNGDKFPVVNDLKNLSRQMISQYFHMPIAQAAKELNIGLSTLQRRCRELGIPRWPRKRTRNKNLLAQSDSDSDDHIPLSKTLPRGKRTRNKNLLSNSDLDSDSDSDDIPRFLAKIAAKK